VLPPGVINPTGPIQNIPTGHHIGWITHVLPFIDQRNVYNHLNFSLGAYQTANISVREVLIRTLICPSDPSSGQINSTIALTTNSSKGLSVFVADNNYAACHNDIEAPIDANNTGCFFRNSRVTYEDIPDGSSNTIFLGEKRMGGTDLGWISGTSASLRNTGTPPNGTSVFAFAPALPFDGLDADAPTKLTTPAQLRAALMVGGFSSRHPGGADFAFGDGSVRFIKDTISKSVFQHLGNRADGDLISSDSF
jgi:prepilin-type processing-associated H-X9-DG protein